MSDTPVFQVGGVVMVSEQWLVDAEGIRAGVDRMFRRLTHPWEFADDRGWPSTFTLVPWLARLQAWWRSRGPKHDPWGEA